jgi:molybdate transport system regulatory protein
MKYGARNQLVGEVASITRGDVMTLTKIKLPGRQQMASVMTTESVDDLELKKGDKVKVIVKAIHVMLVKE